jgi:predicted NAD/FAD-binding protein
MSRIAVIGSGISGLAAAYLLSRRHQVSLFERETRIGGHTHTHLIETSRGTLPIDTGFIVHNDRTYPNLIRLFAELGVQRQPSSMSFAVSCRQTGMEYSSRGLTGFFATWRNLVRAGHYRLLREILRFNREASSFLLDPANSAVPLNEYLRANQFSDNFSRYYLYPMASAVWSTSLEQVEEFPAFTLIRFFDNHGFLGYRGQPTWYTIKGGSHQYIPAITAPYREHITTGAPTQAVHRTPTGVQLTFRDRPPADFDEVVFACHAPQALDLLADPSLAERDVLGKFATTRNQTALHTDSRMLPSRRPARASWNYLVGFGRNAATVTYHMNRLQSLPTREDYCVTLNVSDAIDSRLILRQMQYNHPLYTTDAIQAQARWSEISGRRHTHFAGAYWLYGFHEDGLNSAIRVAAQLGVNW